MLDYGQFAVQRGVTKFNLLYGLRLGSLQQGSCNSHGYEKVEQSVGNDRTHQ